MTGAVSHSEGRKVFILKLVISVTYLAYCG